MTRTQRLEELARKAALTVKVADEESRQAVANAIETEIDSYRPIEEGQYLALVSTTQDGAWPDYSIDLPTDVKRGKYTTYQIAWGEAEEVENKLFGGYNYRYQPGANAFTEFKRLILADGNFIGAL